MKKDTILTKAWKNIKDKPIASLVTLTIYSALGFLIFNFIGMAFGTLIALFVIAVRKKKTPFREIVSKHPWLMGLVVAIYAGIGFLIGSIVGAVIGAMLGTLIMVIKMHQKG